MARIRAKHDISDGQGQLYFKQSWYFASHLEEARRYAGMYGIEIKA